MLVSDTAFLVIAFGIIQLSALVEAGAEEGRQKRYYRQNGQALRIILFHSSQDVLELKCVHISLRFSSSQNETVSFGLTQSFIHSSAVPNETKSNCTDLKTQSHPIDKMRNNNLSA